MTTQLKYPDTRKALEKLLDDNYVRAINPKGIKPSVAQLYMYEIDKLMGLTGSSSMSNMVKDADKLINFIENYKYTTKQGEKVWADNTRKSKYTAIHALIKYGIVKLSQSAIEKYIEREQHYAANHEQVKSMSLPTKKTLENNLSWAKIRQAYDKLNEEAYGSLKHVFASMYVLIPPRRLTEYKNLHIYNRAPRNSKHKNYVVISHKYGESLIHIEEYKTNKAYDTFQKKLPETLVDVIKESLKQNPRTTLIVAPRGRPYKDEASMSKGLTLLFKEIVGVPLSVQELRRLYIDEHFPRLKTHGERKDLADWMGHSIEMQSAYRMDNRESVASAGETVNHVEESGADNGVAIADDDANDDIKTKIAARIEQMKEKLIRDLDEFKARMLELI